MGGFSSSSFAVAAFSVAAFAFDTATPPAPLWRVIRIGMEARGSQISAEMRVGYV